MNHIFASFLRFLIVRTLTLSHALRKFRVNDNIIPMCVMQEPRAALGWQGAERVCEHGSGKYAAQRLLTEWNSAPERATICQLGNSEVRFEVSCRVSVRIQFRMLTLVLQISSNILDPRKLLAARNSGWRAQTKLRSGHYNTRKLSFTYEPALLKERIIESVRNILCKFNSITDYAIARWLQNL